MIGWVSRVNEGAYIPVAGVLPRAAAKDRTMHDDVVATRLTMLSCLCLCVCGGLGAGRLARGVCCVGSGRALAAGVDCTGLAVDVCGVWRSELRRGGGELCKAWDGCTS